jgi:hypothetical protein
MKDEKHNGIKEGTHDWGEWLPLLSNLAFHPSIIVSHNCVTHWHANAHHVANSLHGTSSSTSCPVPFTHNSWTAHTTCSSHFLAPPLVI